MPRLIPSDFAEDFTPTTPGRNRSIDLRRAFMDMLGAERPLIQPRLRRVLFRGSADQPLDFTTKHDVAAFTARAPLDDARYPDLRWTSVRTPVRESLARR